MKRNSSGWHGESRRHSLARKGIKTAKGKLIEFYAGTKLSAELDMIDSDVNDKLSIIDTDLEKLDRFRDEWIDYIKSSLYKMGFNRTDVDYMEIDTWVDGFLWESIVEEMSYSPLISPIEDLSEWIYDHTADHVDTEEIMLTILNSKPLLDLQFNSIDNLADSIWITTQKKLESMGFNEYDIDEMQLETWASHRVLDYIEDDLFAPRSPLMQRTGSLEDWMGDRVELKASGQVIISRIDARDFHKAVENEVGKSKTKFLDDAINEYNKAYKEQGLKAESYIDPNAKKGVIKIRIIEMEN